MAQQSSFILYHFQWKQLSQLTDEEIGKVMRAIFVYHETGEILDIGRIENIVFSSIREKLDFDREKYVRYIEKQSENGKKGGRPKESQLKPNNPTLYLGKPTKAKKADPVPVPVPVPSDTDTGVSLFEEFWKLYPRKLKKPDALRAYSKVTKEHKEILVGLKKYILKWKNDEIVDNFIPYPATWINARQWEDEIQVVAPGLKQSYSPYDL